MGLTSLRAKTLTKSVGVTFNASAWASGGRIINHWHIAHTPRTDRPTAGKREHRAALLLSALAYYFCSAAARAQMRQTINFKTAIYVLKRSQTARASHAHAF
jgi:hypothetical protein